MTKYYFNRIAKLIIHNQNSNQIIVENLRMRFEVTKSVIYNENTARVEIYNMSKQTRDQITSFSRSITLFAGYEKLNGLVQLLNSDIAEIRTTREMTNVITEITCVEGLQIMRNSMVSISYSKTVRAAEIFNDIKKSGFGVKVIDFDVNQTIPDNYADLGSIDAILNNLATQFNFIWSIQNNDTILIVGDQRGLNSQVSNVLNQDTGLILNPNSIQVVSRKIKAAQQNNQIQLLLEGFKSQIHKKKTHKVNALLQANLQVRNLIKIESEDLNGVFKVQKLTHTCDTHGSDWFTDIEVAPLHN